MRYQTPHNHICDELMGVISTKPDAQQFKYGGKELDRFGGMDLYDFEARMLDPIIPGFTNVDPHATDYPSISPYSYCGGDPVNCVDPTGCDWMSVTYGDHTFYCWDDEIQSQEDISSERLVLPELYLTLKRS